MKQSNSDIELFFQFKDCKMEEINLRFTNPIKIISANCKEQVISALSDVDSAVKKGLYAAGYVSYEAAPAFDPVYQTCPKGNMPIIWFALFERPEIIQQTCQQSSSSYHVGNWKPNISRIEYDQNVAKIKNEIKQGNTYQVNYTIRLQADFQGDDFAYYQRLSQSQKSDYSAYLNIGRYRILSASPELFFRRENNTLTTKPMKGTARRGLNIEGDRIQKQFLFSSDKNRAENLMIVDLLRNDLGRISKIGSVRVTKLFELEKYPTVYQMTSTIQSEIPPGTTLVEIFQALFPCGSITGAPKANTMKIIADFEQIAREVYCGAIGYLSPNGNTVFNVPIRTVLIDKELNTAQYGVGGGITWDSTSPDEYDEILAKSALLIAQEEQFDLLETILWEKGKYAYLERHLQRLHASADYFGYIYSKTNISRKLYEHGKLHTSEARRVRLLLSENGRVHVESVRFIPLDSQNIQPVVLANEPINSNNRLLYHKTTCRAIYDKYKIANPQVFDVLLWNEDGEITEFTIGNIVVEINGLKMTPPASCGLLPGVFREELLARGDIIEQKVRLQDLSLASRIWMINSLRGWIPVNIVA